MKQAPFRLEPVLRLRQTEERAAALASAEAAARAVAAREHAERQAAALTTRRPPVTGDAVSFIAAMVASGSAAADVAGARAFAVAQAEQAEAVREQWTAAARRTKALERLKERHLEQLRAAADAVEVRTVDDLVTGQHGRTRSSGEEGTWTD